MSAPKVSIIVPVYRVEKYLAKCLDSIREQTLTDIEVLVVNDGSPDNSQAIIDEFAAKDPRFVPIKKQNGGLSDARNWGIDRAKGEFLAFVDSDDTIAPHMMEEMYQAAKRHNAEIAICDLQKVNEKGEVFRDLPQSPQLPERIDLQKDFSFFGEMSCFACNKLFRADLFAKHRFAKGLHFEDIELIPKLVLDSQTVAKVNQPFYNYFERQDSITKTHTEKGMDMFRAIDAVTEYFRTCSYANKKNDLKRFQVLQGFYSYLAYVAYIKDKPVKKASYALLKEKMRKYGINRKEIIGLQRFGKSYIFSLPLKKQVFYFLILTGIKV